MASQLIALLAAAGLMSSATPASKTPVVTKPAAMVTPISNSKSGVCLAPVTKGKVSKLSDLRKARKSNDCAYQFMQGAAGGGAGFMSATTLVTVGASVGISAGVSAAISDSNNPNP
jgi:hypothetical protein